MISGTLRIILDLDRRRPSARLPRSLDALFVDLACATPPRPASEIEAMIWTLWVAHDDAALARRMGDVAKLINRKRFDAAVPIADALVARDPHWAEAWNKRATLRYLQGRDAESVADIERTLDLEPRHFGALCGFAQICLRQGAPGPAQIAFEAALRIDPHLEGVREAIDYLAKRARGRLN
jgi:tetratricopeptide (TPR) repeat protein